MKFIEDYCSAYKNNTSIYGYQIQNLFHTTSIYIMPMVNPDGVDLVTGFYSPNSSIYKSFKSIADGFATIPFPDGWRANFNGVNFKIYQPFSQSLVFI